MLAQLGEFLVFEKSGRFVEAGYIQWLLKNYFLPASRHLLQWCHRWRLDRRDISIPRSLHGLCSFASLADRMARKVPLALFLKPTSFSLIDQRKWSRFRDNGSSSEDFLSSWIWINPDTQIDVKHMWHVKTAFPTIPASNSMCTACEGPKVEYTNRRFLALSAPCYGYLAHGNIVHFLVETLIEQVFSEKLVLAIPAQAHKCKQSLLHIDLREGKQSNISYNW